MWPKNFLSSHDVWNLSLFLVVYRVVARQVSRLRNDPYCVGWGGRVSSLAHFLREVYCNLSIGEFWWETTSGNILQTSGTSILWEGEWCEMLRRNLGQEIKICAQPLHSLNYAKFGPKNIRKIVRNFRHQVKIHQITFWLGLCPNGGAYSTPQITYLDLRGHASKEKEWMGRKQKRGGKEGLLHWFLGVRRPWQAYLAENCMWICGPGQKSVPVFSLHFFVSTIWLLFFFRCYFVSTVVPV